MVGLTAVNDMLMVEEQMNGLERRRVLNVSR